jgi:hypothetical protein
MASQNEHDVEAGEKPRLTNETSDYTVDDGAVSATLFTLGNSRCAMIQKFAGKFGVEQRGIERVPDCERSDTSMLQTGTLVKLSVKLLGKNQLTITSSGCHAIWSSLHSQSAHSHGQYFALVS